MTALTTEVAADGSRPLGGGLALADFERLLESVLDVAYRTAYCLTRNPADAEDIVQEAALNACRHRKSFQAGTNFKAWFLRIVTNGFYSRCRKASAVHESTTFDTAVESRSRVIWAAYPSPSGMDPADVILGQVELETINQAIAGLPQDYRSVTTLYLVDDLAYQDIAAVLEIPLGTVRSRLHRGRRMLQLALWQVAADRGWLPHRH